MKREKKCVFCGFNENALSDEAKTRPFFSLFSEKQQKNTKKLKKLVSTLFCLDLNMSEKGFHVAPSFTTEKLYKKGVFPQNSTKKQTKQRCMISEFSKNQRILTKKRVFSTFLPKKSVVFQKKAIFSTFYLFTQIALS